MSGFTAEGTPETGFDFDMRVARVSKHPRITKPIWRDPALVAREDAQTGADPDGAGALLRGVATRLGLDPEFVQPVYEDPAEWLRQEAKQPPNLTPENPKLDNAEARARFARVFGRGLTTAVGYALPVQRWPTRPGGAGGPRSGSRGAGTSP